MAYIMEVAVSLVTRATEALDEIAEEVAGRLGTTFSGIEANACVGLLWVVEKVVGVAESTGCESRERGEVHLVPPLGEGVAEWLKTEGERSRFQPPLPLKSINSDEGIEGDAGREAAGDTSGGDAEAMGTEVELDTAWIGTVDDGGDMTGILPT